MSIGKKHWAITEGYIPSERHGPGPAFESHETACLLNAGERDVHVTIMLNFSDREPVGPT